MLPYDVAIARVLERAERLGSEAVDVFDSVGRVLTEDIVSGVALPEADTSAMDGYAISIDALRDDGPWRLRVEGESRAGEPHLGRVTETACRIFTGAWMPPGADSVVIQEDTERDGDSVQILRAPSRNGNVRRRGEDVAEGRLIASQGTRIDPFLASLIAAVDRARVEVSRRPRVAIVSTGSELRPPGTMGKPGSIAESNSVAIAGLARWVGAEVRAARLVMDDLEETQSVIATSLSEADLLVTIGGVSVGDHDVVKEALTLASVELDFWKVRIKPGKPLVLGHAPGCVVLGLPGNPVSAEVTFCLFGLPLLKAMQGRSSVHAPTRKLRLDGSLRQTPGRRGYHRVTVRDGVASPLPHQGSGSASSMAFADGLAIVEEDSDGASEGALVDVLCFSELG